MPEQDTIIDDGLINRFQKLSPDQRKTAISALDDETAQHLLTSVQARVPKAPPLQPTTSADTFGGKVRNALATAAEDIGGNTDPWTSLKGVASTIYNVGMTPFKAEGSLQSPDYTAQHGQDYAGKGIVDTIGNTAGKIYSGISKGDPYETTEGIGHVLPYIAPYIAGKAMGVKPQTGLEEGVGAPRLKLDKVPKHIDLLSEALGADKQLGKSDVITNNVSKVFDDLRKTEHEVIKNGEPTNKGVKNQKELQLMADTARKAKWDNDIAPYVNNSPPMNTTGVAEDMISKIPSSIRIQNPSKYQKLVNDINNRYGGKVADATQIQQWAKESRSKVRAVLAKNNFDKAASEADPKTQLYEGEYEALRDNLASHVAQHTGKDIRADLEQYGHLTEFQQTLNKRPVSPSVTDLITGKYVNPDNLTGRAIALATKHWSSDNSLIRRAFNAAPEYKEGMGSIGNNPNLPVYEAPPRGDPPPPLVGTYNNYNGPTPKTGTPSSIHELISQEPIIKSREPSPLITPSHVSGAGPIGPMGGVTPDYMSAPSPINTAPPPLVNSYGQPNTHIPTGTQGVSNLSIEDALRGGVPTSKAPPPLINTYGPSVSTKTGPSISNIHEIITGTKTSTPSQPVNITPDQPELRGVPQVKKPINPTPKVMTGEPEITPAHAGLNKPISKVKSERIKPPIATPNPQSPPVEGSVVSKPVSTPKPPMEVPIVDLSDIPHDIPSFGPMDKARLHGLREKYYGKSDIEINQKYKPAKDKS